MYYDSNFSNRQHDARMGAPFTQPSLEWCAALDASLETLRQAIDELEDGDPSHERQELVVHLAHSVRAIREMLSEPHRFTAPSPGDEVLRRAS
jgi:hypothetical protein